MAPQDQHESLADIYKEFGSSSTRGNVEQGVIYFNPDEVRVLSESELSAYDSLATVAWTSVVDTQRRFLELIGIGENELPKYREQLSNRVFEAVAKKAPLLHGHTHSVAR